MLMCLTFLKALLLGGLIINVVHIVPGDAIVYYVIPSEPPSSDCPGQPCQTMEFYFNHGDRYFSHDKVNVTLQFLRGNHILNDNQYYVKDLDEIEMIGMGPASDVNTHLSATINFTNITAIHMENLTIEAKSHAIFSIVNCNHIIKTSVTSRLPSEVPICMRMTISKTVYSNIALYAENHCDKFIITIKNSTLLNGSAFLFKSRMHRKNVDYSREWNMLDCTIANSSFEVYYDYAEVTIINTTFVDLFQREDSLVHNCIRPKHSMLKIEGKVLFRNTSNGLRSFPFLIPSGCNVTISGAVKFANNKAAPIVSYLGSIITLSGIISFLNNSGTMGGAIALKPSTLNIASNTTVYFNNNSASETGGAIYAMIKKYTTGDCFYQLLDYGNKYNWYNVQLINNSARNGGDHIFGEYMHSDACIATQANRDGNQQNVGTLSYLVQKYFTYNPGYDPSFSPVSSDATRVCLCGNTNRPQCTAMDKIYGYNILVHPGELFQVSAVVVGADFGTTIGTVYAIFPNKGKAVDLKPNSQHAQSIDNNKVCSMLNYTLFSQRKQEVFYLLPSDDSLTTVEHDFHKGFYKHLTNVSRDALYTPPLLNITLLPCPPGFSLLGDPPGCDCPPVLTNNNVKCLFINKSGYHIWNGSLWLNVDQNITITIAKYCPFDYCVTSRQSVNLGEHPDTQCSINRAGRLCGDCQENYSLAIGSSHCIHCPNNNNLALIIFFAAAGFLLVFFISAFNLTVTQGMINELIFYANIVWAYRSILFPQNADSNLFFTVLQTFIAWLNLDLGIEVCFVKRLNAFWKTWLQYLFPFYIWSIAGGIIYCSKCSAKVTKLLGNRAVSLLATLFLLSYAKLLQTIISSIGFTPLKVFSTDKNYTLTVWSLDGHYTYCHFPHIMLFITAVAIFGLLWLPYTLMLFLMQCLRKISHLKLLRWVPRFSPVYDAYFAPLKDKHHYWFGVLLIVRGILLVVFSLTRSVHPNINYLLLSIISAVLLCYANYNRVYKTKRVQFAENYFFIVLILIGGSEIVNQRTKHAVVYGSIFVTLLAFCGVLLWSALVQIFFKLKRSNLFSNVAVQRENSDFAQLWDSIFDETEPFLETNQTVAIATY